MTTTSSHAIGSFTNRSPFAQPARLPSLDTRVNSQPCSMNWSSMKREVQPIVTRLPSLDKILKQLQHRSLHAGNTLRPCSPIVLKMPSLQSILNSSVTLNVTTPSHQRPKLGMEILAHANFKSGQETQPRTGSCLRKEATNGNEHLIHSPTNVPMLSAGNRVISPANTVRKRASKYCRVEGCQRVSQRNNLCHSHGGKRLCKEEACGSKDRGNGYCIKHGGGKLCSVTDCDKKARRKGLCTQHYRMSLE